MSGISRRTWCRPTRWGSTSWRLPALATSSGWPRRPGSRRSGSSRPSTSTPIAGSTPTADRTEGRNDNGSNIGRGRGAAGAAARRLWRVGRYDCPGGRRHGHGIRLRVRLRRGNAGAADRRARRRRWWRWRRWWLLRGRRAGDRPAQAPELDRDLQDGDRELLLRDPPLDRRARLPEGLLRGADPQDRAEDHLDDEREWQLRLGDRQGRDGQLRRIGLRDAVRDRLRQ